MASAIDSLLSGYPADVQRLVQEARGWVKRLLPHVSEEVDGTAGLISYGYGPGYKSAVCTLILSKSGVKLGLVGGAALPDPHRLLAGSGKVHRHVQLRKAEDLHRVGVQQLLLDASDACRNRLAPSRSVTD